MEGIEWKVDFRLLNLKSKICEKGEGKMRKFILSCNEFHYDWYNLIK